MNSPRLSQRTLTLAGVVLAVPIAAWLSVPLVLGNSLTSKHEVGWPCMPIAFIGTCAFLWFALWNFTVVSVGGYVRRFHWPARTALLALTVPAAVIFFLLLSAAWVFVGLTLQDWARTNTSELWYSTARNLAHTFDRLPFYSSVSGAVLLIATQLLPNHSFQPTHSGLSPSVGG